MQIIKATQFIVAVQILYCQWHAFSIGHCNRKRNCQD